MTQKLSKSKYKRQYINIIFNVFIHRRYLSKDFFFIVWAYVLRTNGETQIKHSISCTIYLKSSILYEPLKMQL